MRTRAYRPEVAGALEDRALPSSVTGLPVEPVVLSHRQLVIVHQQVLQGFQLFARDRFVPHLYDQIHDGIVLIPFGLVDGLGVTIHRIVSRMQDELSARDPRAIRSAYNDVIAATNAEMQSRIQAGDLVIR